MAYLNQRWARDDIPHDEAGYAEIGINDLMTISGKRRPDVARTSAERWRDIAEMSVQHRGDVTVILWPKFAEFQEFRSRTRGDDDPLTPPSASASENASETSKKKSARAPRFAISPDAYECADVLKARLRDVPGATISPRARESWAAEISRLVREAPELHANGREWKADIIAGVEWALGPENLGQPYEVVIRSGKSLREKWPKLRAAMNRKKLAPPKSFAQQQEDETFDWLRRVSDGAETRSLGDGTGAAVRRLPDRGD